MNSMQINTHSETLAKPPVPVGESIIYRNSSRVLRVWIDADTQGAVTSLGSIMESDSVSANGKWGVPVEDPYGSNHSYTFSRGWS